MASSVAAGTIAAFAAPLSMSVGLFAWGENWKGSAFALNLFKNATATVAFLAVSIVAAYVRGQQAFAGDASAAGWLVFSGLIGIVVGDTLWLQALARIGAARTIFVDALKPFTAAVFGRLFLNEAELSALAYVGVALTSVGVTVAAQPQTRELSDEEEEVEEFQDSEKKAGANTFALGYAMALGNVILDTYGAVLTKQHGSQSFTAFEISAIRFGCSAAILLATGLAARMWASFVRKHRQLTYDLDTMTMPPPSSSSWADMPRGMTSKAWLCVLGGVTLTTFTASVLGVYAVMRLPLGVYAALTSLGPVISLPLGYLVRGDRVTPWNAVGACLACAGVAMVVTSTG